MMHGINMDKCLCTFADKYAFIITLYGSKHILITLVTFTE
jgi:hypothetical protein